MIHNKKTISTKQYSTKPFLPVGNPQHFKSLLDIYVNCLTKFLQQNVAEIYLEISPADTNKSWLKSTF